MAPLASPASAAEAAAAPSVSAKGAFLMDGTTGAKVFGKGSDTKRQVASTTKIMTARVVLSQPNLNLDKKVTIKQAYRDYVVNKGASTADLKTGDKVAVGTLLYAMMLPSGCDAAYALADTYGSGSTRSARVKSFIKKMNAKADFLGMTNTKFDSFDGISSTGNNYSTPRDMAKLAKSAYGYSGKFREIIKKTKAVRYATASNGNRRTYTWHNTNQLLGSYSGANGMKTGTTTPSGPCLVFTATRNGKTYIGVVLNASDRYKDAAKLLDYGFGSRTASTMQLRQLPENAQRD
ncbi:serine hydrolase [Streptomyces sp. 184]